LLFGTLLSDASKAGEEYRAGVRVAHLELGWDAYEPREGQFNSAYAAQARQKLQAFRAAGLQVVLGAGLQYPPAWALASPNARYLNQFGTPSGALNLTFNQPLRLRAERYLARLAQDLGPSSFWAVRVGAGGLIETLYPDAWDGAHANSYWAFDANAQGDSGRPPTIPASPLPGWQPAQTSWRGQPLSPAQVQQWYEWYLGALVDGVSWQLETYARLGFSGSQHVLMPGLGSRPFEYATAIAHYLDGSGDGNATMGRGAVWHRVIEKLAGRPNVVAYVSSVADGSGRDDLCQQADRTVSINSPSVNSWSATRWISYNADRFGLAKNGENPGRGDTNAYGKRMAEMATQQARACGFQGLMWAHDANLYDSTSDITLSDLAAVIRQSQ
jgi:hypothetical protein